MNNFGVKFNRIETDLSPKRYLEKFLEKIQPDRLNKVQSGEMVTFTIPVNGNFNLSFIGEKPEKYDIVGNKLTVMVPKGAIFFTYTVLNSFKKREVTFIEVVSAL